MMYDDDVLYEYIAVYADNLLFSARNPEAILHMFQEKQKTKWDFF